MSWNCVRTSQNVDASFNVTNLLRQRYQDSSKDDRDRLVKCWGFTDCGDCHRSDGFCGWCAISSTCLPLPTDTFSKTFPLLSPIRYDQICALGAERFELRTGGLGCQVSTITFLTSVVTIFSTLFGVLILYSIFACGKWIIMGLRAQSGGYALYPVDNEGIKGNTWVRKPVSWASWWRRMRGTQKEFEVQEVDDGTPGRGQVWWTGTKHRDDRHQATENTPLLTGVNEADL